MARPFELNNLLPKFPKMGTPALNTKLPDDEIKEIAECCLSYKLQRQMRLQGFEACEKSTQDFISTVARLEEIMPEENSDVSEQEETNPKSSKTSKKRKRSEGDDGSKFYCALHGHNPHHNTNECRTLKRMREQDKNGNSKDKTESKNKKPERHSQEEMNLMVSEAVKALAKKKRKKTQVTEQSSEKELNLLENLKVSDDSGGDSDVISVQSTSST